MPNIPAVSIPPINLVAVAAAIKTAAAALGINSAEDVGKLLVAFVQALPAIEQGVVSAEPFIMAAVDLIRNGGEPTDDMWVKQLEQLASGSKALEATVDADNQEQGLIP